MANKETVVAKVEDLKNGEMKSISLDEEKEILLCRIDDDYYATGAHCTHYGAALAEGVLSGDRIVCPLHHACFNAKSGDLIEPPARDALPKYETKVENGNVIVSLPDELPFNRVPDMTKKDSSADSRKFVILGGGVAGNAAAQAMRESGFKGNILMISQENRLPYDRPNLSKDYLQGEAQPEWMPLRDEEFYKSSGIDLLLGKKVTGMNFSSKELLFENGDKINYDKLLITSGGSPRKLIIKGSDLKNIFYLRSFDDADNIIEASKNAKEAVVLGSSFIGMESAFSLTKQNLNVTIVAPDNHPFEKTLGKEIGELIQSEYESKGIKFKLGKSVIKFEGSNNVDSVVLDSGEKLNADLVLIGIGVRPATNFIEGINLLSDGSINVDKYFQAAEFIYAAGDIATFVDNKSGEELRIEHYRTAEQQGRIAGSNMADKLNEYRSEPFFWTQQADLTIQYVGHAVGWDKIQFIGNVKDKKFLAFYIKNNQVHAVAGIDKEKEMAAIQELMRMNRMPAGDKIDDSFDPVEELKNQIH